MKETVKDIDILVTSVEPTRVMELFVGLPQRGRGPGARETSPASASREGTQAISASWRLRASGRPAILHRLQAAQHPVSRSWRSAGA